MSEATVISRYSLNWAQAGNSIGARLVSLGVWNVVRVGLLWSIRQDVNGTIAPEFAFGLCAGTAAVYGDASVTHFVGVTSSGNWEINGNNFLINTDILPSKKVGVTLTTGTALSTTHVINAQIVNNYRTVTFVEITKGSPNYSFKLFHRNLDTAADYNVTNLTTVMESGAPALANHVFTGAQTLAVDEGVDGTLTAAQFYWNLTTSNAEIDAIQISKIS